jgi:hypothetical protein
MDSDNLALFSAFETIIASVKKRGYKVVDITLDPDASQYIFSYTVKSTEIDNQLAPLTPRQQSYLSNKIKSQFGRSALFLFNPVIDVHQIELGLLALIRNLYQESTLNVFLTLKGNLAQITVDGIQKIDSLDIEVKKIDETIRPFLAKFGKSIEKIEFLGITNRMPSKTELLSAVKITAPCLPNELLDRFQRNHYSGIPDRWLASQLDLLRKGGFILRRSDGRYVPTLNGLNLLPRSKSRNSSDIQRALAVSKRRC